MTRSLLPNSIDLARILPRQPPLRIIPLRPGDSIRTQDLSLIECGWLNGGSELKAGAAAWPQRMLCAQAGAASTGATRWLVETTITRMGTALARPADKR
jgi:hypothetical protein